MTEQLFQFLILRPPVSGDSTRPPIILAQETDFQKELGAAATSATPNESLLSISRAFIRSDRFIPSVDGRPFQKHAVQFSAILDKFMDAGRDELAAVESTVEQVFGNKPAELVESEPFVQILEDLKDSIIAIKFVQEEHYRPIAGLSDQLRDLELIQKLAEEQSQSHALEPSGREFLQVEETEWSVGKQYDVGDRVRHIGIIYKCKKWHLSQSDLEPQLAPEFWEPVMPEVTKIDIPLYRKRTLLLPLEMDLKPLVSSPAEKRCEGGRDMCQDEKEAEKLLTEHTDLKSAIAELLKLSPESFEAEGPKGAEGADVDPKFTRNTIVGDQLEYRKSLRTIALVRANAVGSTSPDPSSVRLAANSPTPTTPTTPTNPVPPVNTEPIGAFNLAKELLSGEGMLGPLSAFKASPTAERTPRLKTDASQKLSDTTKKVLKEQGIDITTSSVNDAVKSLNREVDSHMTSLQDLIPAAENVSYTRIGSAIISAKTPVLSRATGLLYGYDIPKDIPALPALPQDGRVPHTKGKATPSGIADLLVVKQTLKSYQAADIAHVENVLKGENKNRTHKKTTRTESMINFETETNSTDDHELSSTSRFEMSKETNNTLKEAQNLKAELKVSAKYGPAVTINASVEGSMSRNKEEANKAASKFAQDTTERTAKKVTERVLERQTTTNVSEIVEENQHGINNATGGAHISGVYQWLNKVYEAQVFNYGMRTMFDFMVPEPAAFLTHAFVENLQNTGSEQVIDKPTPFTYRPSQITEAMVGNIVARYQATDVNPPPEDYVTLSDQAALPASDSRANFNHGSTLAIPSGYKAIWANVSCVRNVWVNDTATIDVIVGSETHRLGMTEWTWPTPLSSTGSVAWGFNTYNISDGVISVEILCRVTDRRKQQWQAETHAKLLSAYKQRLQDYEEKIAKLKINDGITIQGTNPTANLNTIKTELKKHCISILTGQHFELFNSLDRDLQGRWPEIDFSETEAEGTYVRFFEQAFEWDQLMFTTYPYFWGSRDYWVTKLAINDTDPVFDEFLKSGFARVVAPVRPGFEGAVDHFLRFGVPWNGGPLPLVTSQAYIAIADELAELKGKPEGETAQGEPWEITLPTTLLKLRGDDMLPTWTKVNGKWVPDV